jgi:hypothetical protein
LGERGRLHAEAREDGYDKSAEHCIG